MMTSDEAREVFDDAFEGELGPSARADFDAALAADRGLAVEWEDFVRAMRMVRGVGLDEIGASMGPGGRSSSEPLLRGVQSKLRTRSRGRFYRDRFASVRREELILPIVLAAVAILLVVVAWAGHHVVDVAPASSPPARAPR